MAGHSQFANIMHRKGAQDKKRARLFSKLVREMMVSARQNPDPDANPRLRSAIVAAKAVSMPKENIERAIRRGSGQEEGVTYEEVRYEGLAPGGVGLIVEALTDNRNRTATEVRTIFGKNGGKLGELNSVAFMFSRVGTVLYPAAAASADAMFEAALEAGAQDVASDADRHEITVAPDDLATVRDALEAKFGPAESAKLGWKPNSPVPVAEEDVARDVFKLIDLLEENDDVQTVYANFDIPDELMQKLAA
ncbi:MAG: YebC/PmpR family DNA-binding transcriptional regulator [Rhodospirillaceae bacterium]|nr:YebC/PmpR family DNA-binding transcriptional regulator [Rhodospirillaceae bacterium]